MENNNLIGLRIKLARPSDQKNPCCRNITVIQPGGELHCIDCGQHRGRLGKITANWIENVITRFGAPTTPIVVRPATIIEEENMCTK